MPSFRSSQRPPSPRHTRYHRCRFFLTTTQTEKSLWTKPRSDYHFPITSQANSGSDSDEKDLSDMSLPLNKNRASSATSAQTCPRPSKRSTLTASQITWHDDSTIKDRSDVDLDENSTNFQDAYAVPFLQIEGPKHIGLWRLAPSPRLLDQLMSSRYHLLRRTTATQTNA